MTEPQTDRPTGRAPFVLDRAATRRRRARQLLGLCVVGLCLWVIVSLAVAYQLTRRPRRLFAEPAPAITWGKLERHQLETNDGEKIGAWFLQGAEDVPSVLLLHGHRGSRRNCLGRAEMLAGQGCSVLLISLRAHGDSTGEFNDFGYSARHDVVAGVEFLERRRPGKPIIVHGISMGAAAAIFASEPLGGRVSGYILETPYRDLKVAVRNRTRAHLPPVFDWVAYQGLVMVSPLVIPELDKISALAALGGIPRDVPVLLLAGAADHSARPAEVRSLFDRISAHAHLTMFEGCDHRNLQAQAPDRFTRAVVPFVEGIKESTTRQ